MKIRLLPAHRHLTLAAFLSATAVTSAQDGALDGTFTPTVGVGGLLHTAVPQPDGSILVAGQFTSIARNATDPLSTRFRIARFENSGALDPNYSPNTNSIVWNLLVQPDSSVVAAGEFDRVNFTNNVLDPTTRVRHRVAKFDKTGAVDQFYSPALQAATSIFSLTAAAGGKVLIAGPPGYYMLDEEGVVVQLPSFYSYQLNAQNFAVYGIAMRPDQRFYAYGQFGNPAYTSYSVNSDYLELLGQNGRFPFPGPQGQDSNPFNLTGGSVVAGAVHATVVLPDGKVIIGGIFPAPPAPPPPLFLPEILPIHPIPPRQLPDLRNWIP